MVCCAGERRRPVFESRNLAADACEAHRNAAWIQDRQGSRAISLRSPRLRSAAMSVRSRRCSRFDRSGSLLAEAGSGTPDYPASVQWRHRSVQLSSITCAAHKRVKLTDSERIDLGSTGAQAYTQSVRSSALRHARFRSSSRVDRGVGPERHTISTDTKPMKDVYLHLWG
jgi:hypothetical protein